jgi:hypothetical protein
LNDLAKPVVELLKEEKQNAVDPLRAKIENLNEETSR